MATILCIASSESRDAGLERTLADAGHETVKVAGLQAGLSALDRRGFDLVIAEFHLPDGTTLDLLSRLRELELEIPVLVTTAYAGSDDARLALCHGAHDYLTRPLRSESLRLAVRHALEVARLRRENGEFRRELDALGGGGAIVGVSPRWLGVMDALAGLSGDDRPVLLEGESGTGKGLLARVLHEMGPRRDRPLVAVNCAALAPGEAEGVVFGGGAARGAPPHRDRGALERARGGTLVLEEIAALPPALQPRLLAALGPPEGGSAGTGDAVPPVPRLIATTTRDLAAEALAGRIEPGLSHRLAYAVVRVPSLRERSEDFPALLDHFVRLASARLGVLPPAVAPGTATFLRTLTWPGNVRELANAVERAVILGRDGTLTPEHFAVGEPPRARGDSVAPTAGEAAIRPPEVLNLRELERRAIRDALFATRGHRGRAAELLGISVRTLRNRIVESPDLAIPRRRGSG